LKGSSLASRPGSLVCPRCEIRQLQIVGHHKVRCVSCGSTLNGGLLDTLQQITDLPDVLGRHACECGHPEMRHLPDGTSHCPACGSEVLPIEAASSLPKFGEYGEAYWAGWLDGRFGETSSFVDNSNLAKWEEPSDRLAYYRGHRAGSEARLSKSVVRTERPQQRA
jgi:Zn finger protein HypA/HybF involved in hydrogenase expression